MALVCSIPLCFVDAGAQQAGEETIDEIQVTATRRPATTDDVSAALTLITAEEIRGSALITDALAAEVGVFLQQTTPGQGAAIVRGLKGSEVLHLVDGLRLNNAIFRNAPTQYLAFVAPGGVDRIEIVRGAPTSLYGSDAVGGVVQVLSRMPEFDSPGRRAELYGAFDSAELGKTLRASFDAGNDRVAGLVSGEYVDTGNRRIGDGQRVGPSGYRSKGVRFALSVSPGEDRNWLFDYQFATQPGTPRFDELVPGFGQTEPSSSEFRFAPNERHFAHVRHTRAGGPFAADWTVDAGWQRIVDDRVTRDFNATIRTHEENSSDLFGLTVSAAREMTRGSWVAGAEFYHDEVSSRRVEEALSDGQLTDVQSRFPDGSTVDHAAIYASITRYIGQRNALSAGVRFSAVGVDLAATAAGPAADIDQDDFSGDIGWIFDLSGRTQLVANLAHGFRAPNVFDLGTLGERPGNRFNVPNPDLESERVTQFDVGVRHRGEALDVSVTLYTLHYTDRISSVLTGAVTPDGRDVVQSRNVESADIRGVEAAARYTGSNGTTADLVLNHTWGEQTEAGGVTVAGDRIPPFNGKASLRLTPREDVAIEPYLLFAAGQARLSPRDVRDVRIDPNGTPGWMTVNVRGEWDLTGELRLSADLTNLLDRRYRMHGSGIDAPGRGVLLSLHWLSQP